MRPYVERTVDAETRSPGDWVPLWQNHEMPIVYLNRGTAVLLWLLCGNDVKTDDANESLQGIIASQHT